ncbi:MAG TPA: rhodanese-like domain-containing protein [Pyrinomonadaceae bacterium]|nr:rhodanese-like domain-containing protein [Pyrinomonadaceae bacterium]
MRRTAACLLTVSLFTIFVIAGCSSSKRVVAEAPPGYQPTPQSAPVQMAVKPAAKLADVQEAVKRVFKDAAVIDTKSNPNFVAGDFNGDSSQDIAVILKPAKLDQMNEQYPPWLLRDPLSEHSPRTPLKIEKDETLLAVIHGYGANDWRDPEATQTFVLKNVVGNDLRVHSGKEFVSANSGRKLPRPQGDLIGETLHGSPGYLYYFASNYSWYDPKTFQGEAPRPGMFHQPKAQRAHAVGPQTPTVARIGVEELKAKINNNQPVTIIDVRSSEGFANSSTTIKGSIHFKVRRLRSRLSFPPLKDLPKNREIVVYCACPNDEASIAAAQILQAAGFQRVEVLQGGWLEWLKANGPVQSKPRG